MKISPLLLALTLAVGSATAFAATPPAAAPAAQSTSATKIAAQHRATKRHQRHRVAAAKNSTAATGTSSASGKP